jgi:hypothetical protein
MKCSFFVLFIFKFLSKIFIQFNFGFAGRIEQPADSLFTYSGSMAYNKFHDQKENIHTWMQFVPWYKWDDPMWKFPNKATFG